MNFFYGVKNGIVFAVLQAVCLVSLSNAKILSEDHQRIKEKKNGPDPELIITSSAILENMGMNKHLEHKETEETKFDDLLTETAYALRKADPKLLKKLVIAVDKVGHIERAMKIPASLQMAGWRHSTGDFRDHFIATIVEWFHLLRDVANQDTIQSKLMILNKNLFTQFHENRELALKLISDLAEKSLAAGLTSEEQMILFGIIVETGAIEKIKSIALHEIADHLHSDLPEDDSILKTLANLMVEKVFEAKYHEIEKNMMNENEVYLSLADSEDCTSLDCSEKHANKRCPRKCGKHANLKVDLLHSKKILDHIHKKSIDGKDAVSNIKILLQALNSRSQMKERRRKRFAKQREQEDDTKEVRSEDRKEAKVEELNQKKNIKHSFKTRIHGDKNRKMVLSQIPITDDETIVQETIDFDVDEGKDSGDYRVSDENQEDSEDKEKIRISIKEEDQPVANYEHDKNYNIKPVEESLDVKMDKASGDKNKIQKEHDQKISKILQQSYKIQDQPKQSEVKEKLETMTESDITKELIPKFQKIYADKSLDSKEKDRKMIQLITDMMSDPRIQSSIIKMLEKHLKDMNVRKATHLVLMAMERTSFGSGEDVLEEMFDTWEPFLSKAIELVGIESLATVCAIHAAVEKVAKPHQQRTLRILTKKVLDGLSDKEMAQRLSNGMSVALKGTQNDILDALQDKPAFLSSDMRVHNLKKKTIPLTAIFPRKN